MKFGLFLLYGVLVFVWTLTECFLLNGGITLEKDPFGINRINLKGKILPYDWVKIILLTVVAAFMAGIAPKTRVAGIIAMIVAILMMAYVCYWGATEISRVKEIVVLILLLVTFFSIARMGTIRFGSLAVLPRAALAICIAIVIASCLIYRAGGGHLVDPSELSQQKQVLYKYSAYGILIAAAVVVIVMLFTSIT